jgi:predicted nucleic acid-binding protein
MNVFYLDASAWVKLYVNEAGSQWIEDFWNSSLLSACSDLGLSKFLPQLPVATRSRRDRPLPTNP